MKSDNTCNIFEYFENYNDFVATENLQKYSVSEYANIIQLGIIDGVEIDALDMSSEAKTGTFKDWVACATVAYCKQNNIQHFVTQSSGNTANALAEYCRHFKQKVTIFFLKSNSSKIKPQFFPNSDFIDLVEVDASEARMKELTSEFSDTHNVPWLPNLELQNLANCVRADFVTSYSKKNGRNYDWHSQSLSSGYGVFGFYDGLRRLNQHTGFSFLGVQQTAVCPFIKRLAPSELEQVDLSNEVLIEPTLFRSKPTEKLFALMESVIQDYGGAFSLVSNAIYENTFQEANVLLKANKLELVQNNENNVVEKSGLIDLIGTINAIRQGKIREGQRILISLTGGFGAAPKGVIRPTRTVR